MKEHEEKRRKIYFLLFSSCLCAFVVRRPKPFPSKTGWSATQEDDKVTDYRSDASMLPPSTVRVQAVTLEALASHRKASATSSAVTSRPSRLPPM